MVELWSLSARRWPASEALAFFAGEAWRIVRVCEVMRSGTEDTEGRMRRRIQLFPLGGARAQIVLDGLASCRSPTLSIRTVLQQSREWIFWERYLKAFVKRRFKGFFILGGRNAQACEFRLARTGVYHSLRSHHRRSSQKGPGQITKLGKLRGHRRGGATCFLLLSPRLTMRRCERADAMGALKGLMEMGKHQNMLYSDGRIVPIIACATGG